MRISQGVFRVRNSGRRFWPRITGYWGGKIEGCGPLRTGSAQNLMDHAAMHIRKADIPAAEAVGESLVIETE